MGRIPRLFGEVETRDTWSILGDWRRSLPAESVFACSTAAWMHGLGAKAMDPVEIMLPPTTSIRSRFGLTVRRSDIAPQETTAVNGLSATTLHRTLRDLSLFSTPLDALIAIDTALHKRQTTSAKLLRDPVAKKGRRGAARLVALANLAAPAESPMETRLRWLLLKARLPKPEVQVDLGDRDASFLGRADLYYRTSRLVIEFDGGSHRDRLVSDDRRQNLLVNAGFRVLRFTARDVFDRPEVVVAQVRGSLV